MQFLEECALESVRHPSRFPAQELAMQKLEVKRSCRSWKCSSGKLIMMCAFLSRKKKLYHTSF